MTLNLELNLCTLKHKCQDLKYENQNSDYIRFPHIVGYNGM